MVGLSSYSSSHLEDKNVKCKKMKEFKDSNYHEIVKKAQLWLIQTHLSESIQSRLLVVFFLLNSSLETLEIVNQKEQSCQMKRQTR